MVLRLKTRESRSLPGLPSIWCPSLLKTLLRAHIPVMGGPIRRGLGPLVLGDAGWSSPVARQAHNLKVAGSNPAPATKRFFTPRPLARGVFRICLHTHRENVGQCATKRGVE